MWKIVKIETQHLYNHTLKIVLQQHCLGSLRQICKSTKQRVFSEQEGKRRKYLNRWQQSCLVFHLISHLIVSMCTVYTARLPPEPIACQNTLASDCPLLVDMMCRLLRNIFAWKLFTNIFGCFFEANCLRSSRPKCTWVEAWIVPRSLDNMAISSPKIQQGTISNSSQSNEVKKCIVAFSSFYFIFSIFFAAGGGNIFFGSGISWKLELPVRFPMEKSLTHSNWHMSPAAAEQTCYSHFKCLWKM